jgi:hypothetical protein
MLRITNIEEILSIEANNGEKGVPVNLVRSRKSTKSKTGHIAHQKEGRPKAKI